MYFIDLEKAFFTVKHVSFVNAIRRFGVDNKDIRVFTSLNWEQKKVMRVGDETSEVVEKKQGVRQGCVLSPDLFSLPCTLN